MDKHPIEYGEVSLHEVFVEQADACAFVIRIPGDPDENFTLSVSVRACVTMPCPEGKQLQGKWMDVFSDVMHCCDDAVKKLMEERSVKANESGQENA